MGSVKENSYEVEPDLHCLLWIKTPEGFSYGSLICFPEESSIDTVSLNVCKIELVGMAHPLLYSISQSF